MSEMIQLVTFTLKDTKYAIEIEIVNEVNPTVNMIPIPLSSPFIRGMVNIRGQAILVLDLLKIFGYEKTKISNESHIVILKTSQDLMRTKELSQKYDLELYGDKPVAFLVEKTGDVAIINKDDIETPTQFIEKTSPLFLRGVVKINDTIMVIINSDTIIKYTKDELIEHY